MKTMMIKTAILILIIIATNTFAAQKDFRQISNFLSNSNAEQWFAWKVDLLEGSGIVCCSHYFSNDDKSNICTCDLGQSNSAHIQIVANELIADDELIIYFKVADGKPDRIKAISNSCIVNTADKKIIWLDNISAKSSIEFLKHNFRALDRRDNQGGNIIQALAYHQDDLATEALVTLHHQITDREQHGHIELMLSTMRGEQGLEFVIAQYEYQKNDDIREELIFSISQSPESRAKQKIVKIASNDKTAAIREKAIFWLSQMEIKNNAELIMQLITEEVDKDVKLHGVFALSQVENGAGLPYLEELIRTSKYSYVRQQALFWLVESDEDLAMPILESILGS